MIIETLCPPAIVFIVFVMVHVIMELYDYKYKRALLKTLLAILVVCLLEALCLSNMSIISWVIVFMPLIIYSYMTLIIFFVLSVLQSLTKIISIFSLFIIF